MVSTLNFQHSTSNLSLHIPFATTLRLIDELELREKEFAALSRPSKRNYNSLLSNLYQDQDICPEEESCFLYPDQMVSLANGTDNSWLDSKVEAILDRIPFTQVCNLL